MDINKTYCDNFAIYTNIESLYYTLETNVLRELHLNKKPK